MSERTMLLKVPSPEAALSIGSVVNRFRVKKSAIKVEGGQTSNEKLRQMNARMGQVPLNL